MVGCGVRELIPGRVLQLCDAVAAFPEPLDRALPGATGDPVWLLHAHCYLILAGGGPVLVDTGIGPADGRAGRWLGVGGELPRLLPRAGVRPEDVTTVVLSHLHLDHVGWNAGPAGPTFPNATYVVQQAELDHSRATSGDPDGTHALQVGPLIEAGALRAVDGRHRLGPGLEVTRTPGHSPGHQSLSGDFGRAGRVLFAGDAFVHQAQIINPIQGYAHESDRSRAATTRAAILASAAEYPFLLAPAHLPHPVRLPLTDR